jgi:hypothetical protein
MPRRHLVNTARHSRHNVPGGNCYVSRALSGLEVGAIVHRLRSQTHIETRLLSAHEPMCPNFRVNIQVTFWDFKLSHMDHFWVMAPCKALARAADVSEIFTISITEEMWCAWKFCLESLKRLEPFKHPGTTGSIILKRILIKRGVRLWTGFIWLVTGACSRF